MYIMQHYLSLLEIWFQASYYTILKSSSKVSDGKLMKNSFTITFLQLIIHVFQLRIMEVKYT